MAQAERIAVVTGANRGIGWEIARELVRLGYRVIGTSRDLEEGRAAARETGAEPFQLDVTDREAIERLTRHLDGGLDALVNNAGMSLQGFNAGVARKTIDTNFYGSVHVTDRLLPLLRQGGRVVMVSSGLGELSGVGPELRARFASASLTREQLFDLAESFVRDVANGSHAEKGWPSSAYNVSKVAMNAYVRVLARELENDPRRILVNAANPGWVRTRMGGSGAPRSLADGARTPVWLVTRVETTGGFFKDERPTQF